VKCLYIVYLDVTCDPVNIRSIADEFRNSDNYRVCLTL